MVCSVLLEVSQQPVQAQTQVAEDAATDKLCLKRIKIARIVPSEMQCLKLRANKNISVFEFFGSNKAVAYRCIYMLSTGWEVRIGKNCARGLEYGPRPQTEGRTQDRGHSFSQYGPTKASE